MIKQVFYNANERRIRSFWRLLITGLFSFIGVLFCSIAIQLFVGRPLVMMLVGAPVTLGLVLGCVTIGGRLLDRRKLEDFGLHLERRWFTDLAFGLALSLMLVTGIVAVEFAAGWSSQLAQAHRLYPEEPQTLELATLVVFFLCVGIYEELAFRGYMLKNLAEGWNWRAGRANNASLAAVLATSLLFGIIHGMNPHATLISVCNTVLSGLLLSLGLLLTGELAIPIGFHVTWNLTQSVVYGLPVSGVSLGGGLFALQISGPVWLTGGDYGPEGGLLCTLALLAGMLLTVAWVRFGKRPLRITTRLGEAPTKAVESATPAETDEQVTDEQVTDD